MNQAIQDKLESLVETTVKSDQQVRNCMLTVTTGTGDFYWSGAAGLANEKENIGITVNTPFYTASITKLFTAVLVMQLYEAGRIGLEDAIRDYLPDSLIDRIHVYKGVDYTDRIQVRHLLSHTSGIPDYYEKAPKGGQSFFERLLAEPDREWSVEDTIKLARDKLEPGFAPGEKAEYSDTNFQLLGFIIEAVSGQTFNEVLINQIFEPVGMNQSWLYTRSQPIKPSDLEPARIYYKDLDITSHKAFESSWADGGIISSMQDCFGFLQALNAGKLIKDKANLARMRKWKSIQFPLKYGYGTMYFKLPRIMNPFSPVPAIWGHSGSTGSFLFYCEALDLYMVGTINQAKNPGKPFQMMTKIMSMFKKVKSG